MSEVVHASYSFTSTPAGRGNHSNTWCGMTHYWGSGNPEHVVTDPPVRFAEEVEDVTCEDCILAKLGNLP
jgi:hypothetical protein